MDASQLSDSQVGLLAGMIMGALPFIIAGLIIYYVVLVIAWWKVFQKAGEPGWKAIIPFYNVYVMYKFTWKTSMFWVYLILDIVSQVLYFNVAQTDTSNIWGIISIVLSLVLLVVEIIQLHKMSLSFGHGAGFTVGLVILNPIFMLILGYGASQYKGNPEQLEA